MSICARAISTQHALAGARMEPKVRERRLMFGSKRGEAPHGAPELPFATSDGKIIRQPKVGPPKEKFLWWDSSQHRKLVSNLKKTAAIYIAVFLVAWIGYLYGTDSGWIDPYDEDTLNLMFLLSFASIAATATGLYVHYNVLYGEFLNSLAADKVNELEDEEKRLANESKDGNFKLTTLWLVTQKRINVYHNIATNQAESSFRVGRIVSLVGFLAVVALGVLAAFATNGTAAIAASVVGVAAAGMSGYIGATFMKAQAEASTQLRQFFLQPVETARLLALERLVETLEPEHRTQAVMEIVKTMGPQQDPAADTAWVLQRLNPNGK